MGLTFDQLRENYGQDLSAVNIAQHNNDVLNQKILEMLDIKRRLMSTFRYTQNNIPLELEKYQNALYDTLWFKIGEILDLAEPHLIDRKTKPDNEERKLVEEIRKIIDYTPYNTYDLKILTTKAQQLYALICKKGFFEISPRYMQKGGIDGMMRG